MKYVCARGSRQGGRVNNEDRVAVAERDGAVLMVLGDGLGGHKGGAIASETLCRVAIQAFRAIRSPLIQDPSDFLAFVVFQADRALKQLGKQLTPPIEPRTTCVLCLVQNGCAYWAHVGDSRLYYFHHETLLARTQDHTHVDNFRARGILNESESRAHPDKSHLYACLGGSQDTVVSLGSEVPLKPGDLLLLCSDGVWEALQTPEVIHLLSHPVMENGLADLLLEAENRRQKAADNISAVALRWQDQAATATGLVPTARRMTAQEFWDVGQKRVIGNKLKELKAAAKAPSDT